MLERPSGQPLSTKNFRSGSVISQVACAPRGNDAMSPGPRVAESPESSDDRHSPLDNVKRLVGLEGVAEARRLPDEDAGHQRRVAAPRCAQPMDGAARIPIEHLRQRERLKLSRRVG